MIRVTIEVDEYEHRFTSVRETEYVLSGATATVSQIVKTLTAQAEASMLAALDAAPQR